MSKRAPARVPGELPLPSPRSPRELDERILARARAAAPRRPRPAPLAWAGGLATAAVLVMAVYLVNLSESGRTSQAPAGDAVAEQESAGEPVAANSSPARPALKMSAARSEADFAAQEAAGAAAAAPANEVAPRPDSGRTLRRLQALVAAGKREQAEREYQALRRGCTDCGLPQTLDRALAELPPREQ